MDYALKINDNAKYKISHSTLNLTEGRNIRTVITAVTYIIQSNS